MQNLKDKPKGVDDKTTAHQELDKMKQFLDGKSEFSAINTETAGKEIGAIDEEKYEWVKIGDRLVGYYRGHKVMNMKDDPILFFVDNIEANWSFFAGTVLRGRMAEVKPGLILDITLTGEKPSRQRADNYRTFLLKVYEVPAGFNQDEFLCDLSKDGKNIIFKKRADLDEDRWTQAMRDTK